VGRHPQDLSRSSVFSRELSQNCMKTLDLLMKMCFFKQGVSFLAKFLSWHQSKLVQFFKTEMLVPVQYQKLFKLSYPYH
jgi:hypothetical protein